MKPYIKLLMVGLPVIIAASITGCSYIKAARITAPTPIPILPTTAPLTPTALPTTVISATPTALPTTKISPIPTANTIIGKVKGTNGKAISGAKVILLDSKKSLPPLAYTDSEGYFIFPWRGDNVHIEIEADGFESQDRRLNPDSNSEIEEFRLSPSQ